MMRTLTRLFVADGDMTGLALYTAGVLAMVGLMARLVGVWP